jgi:hypothetical protein
MNLALWTIAIVLAVVFGASGRMKQFVPKDKLVTPGPGLGEGLQPYTYPIARTRRNPGHHRASPAGRSAHRPDTGSSRARTCDGRAVFVYAVTKFHTSRRLRTETWS